MGCDGGTIPRRDELVKVKKKTEVKDKESELNFQWRCCAITQQLLQEPIVTCHLGKLYNKLSLIEALLNKDMLSDTVRHIKNLKDVVELKLTKNPSYVERNANNSSNTAPYICPVIGLEMSGKFRFIALWGCGCVFSERALKEVATKVCHKCQRPFQETDVIVLNPTKEDLVMMRKNMETRQMSRKNKEKKIKSKVESTFSKSNESANIQPIDKTNDSVNSASSSSTSGISVVGSTTTTSITAATATTTNALGASGTSSTILKKRSGTAKEIDEHAKKIKADYSLARDPHVSDVYKSIFTSHKSEKEQTRAHWVTYNPFYN